MNRSLKRRMRSWKRTRLWRHHFHLGWPTNTVKKRWTTKPKSGERVQTNRQVHNNNPISSDRKVGPTTNKAMSDQSQAIKRKLYVLTHCSIFAVAFGQDTRSVYVFNYHNVVGRSGGGGAEGSVIVHNQTTDSTYEPDMNNSIRPAIEPSSLILVSTSCSTS